MPGIAKSRLEVVVFKERFYDLYEMLPGFVAGFAATIGVSLATTPPDGAVEEFEAVWRDVERRS